MKNQPIWNAAHQLVTPARPSPYLISAGEFLQAGPSLLLPNLWNCVPRDFGMQLFSSTKDERANGAFHPPLQKPKLNPALSSGPITHGEPHNGAQPI